MELYKEHNVNPFASCLPLVFQMPVFIGLYQVLRSFHPTADTAFLGIDDIFETWARSGHDRARDGGAVLRLSMLGSTLLFSFVQDRQQKFLFASMSMIFITFILRVPAGVGIYWITTNVWTICQKGLVKRTMGHHFPVVEKQEKEKRAQGSRAPRAILPRTRPGSGGRHSRSRRQEAPVTEYERVEVETSGETVGEARWAALHELERRFPSLDRDAVEFVVLSRVSAVCWASATSRPGCWRRSRLDPDSAQPAVRRPPPADESGRCRSRARPAGAHVLGALGDRRLRSRSASVTACVTGDRARQRPGTADRQAWPDDRCHPVSRQRDPCTVVQEAPAEVVVDAEGYRKRRERTLHEVAVKAPPEAAAPAVTWHLSR